MHSLANSPDVLSVILLVLLLGMRHGFDADHLAAIDGLTRYNHKDNPKLARLAGLFFSLGHGLIIVPISVGAATLAHGLNIPEWLNGFGTWVSVTILLTLAIANIRGVLHTPKSALVSLRGWRYQWFAGYLNVRSSSAMLAVGAVFALSFDTLSQAALFAVIAGEYQRWQLAFILAVVFVSGMLLTDGINGLFIAHLIKRSDQTARIASRVMALTAPNIHTVSQTLPEDQVHGLLSSCDCFVSPHRSEGFGLNIAAAMLPNFDAWRVGKELWLGLVVMLVLIASYGIGQRLSRTT